jgi:hypothetical protein
MLLGLLGGVGSIGLPIIRRSLRIKCRSRLRRKLFRVLGRKFKGRMPLINVIGGPLRSPISFKIDLICYKVKNSNDYTKFSNSIQRLNSKAHFYFIYQRVNYFLINTK